MTTLTQPKTWIVLPVYWDTESFLELRKKIPVSASYLLIDDSAGEDSAISKLENDPTLRILKCPRNMGHQKALVYGLRTLVPELGDNDIILTMDSDGEDKPEDVPLLQKRLIDNPDKIILAYRTKRNESLPFKILYFFFKILFRLATGRIIRSGNFAGFRSGFIKQFLGHPFFDLCYSSTLLNLGVPIEYIPCERGRRYQGSSHMSYLKLIKHGFSMMLPFRTKIYKRLRFALFTLLGILVGSAIFSQSNTYDEPCFITAGVTHVATGKIELETVYHPPLQKYLMGLAVLSAFPSFPMGLHHLREIDPFLYGHRFFYENRIKPEFLLALGRLPTLFLSLLLAGLLFAWAQRWFGEGGALLALTAYILEPNILAHSSIASMDIGVTAFMFAACYFSLKWHEEKRRHDIYLAGAFAGFAMATKLSGAFVFFWIAILLLTLPLFDNEKRFVLKKPVFYWTFSKTLVAVLFCAIAMIVLIYQVRYAGMFLDLLKGMVEVVFGDHPTQRYPNFFHGQNKWGGWWYYFPIAFLIKTTLPWLILLGLSLAVVPWKKKGPLLLLCGSFLLVCSISDKHNGLRYFLPAFPFFCLLIGGLAPALGAKRWARWFISGMLMWMGIEVGCLFPNWLTYFNQTVGGPSQGYKWLVDCNLDWGQNMPQLRSYLKNHGNPEVIVACFGTVNHEYYLGPHQTLIFDHNTTNGRTKHINSQSPEREWLIVSATLLQGFGLSDPKVFSWLQQKTPLAQVANSIFIYDVTHDAESQFKIGEIYHRNGQSAYADRQLQRAKDIISQYKTAGK
ncbi:MAG: hypothetical protein KCHDKBKB_01860 [Elusimicrobia bacterium]|nr:hypothetical protein [Elusimicrobiota bacterium]